MSVTDLQPAMCDRTRQSQLDLLPTRTVEYSSNPPLCPQPKDPYYPFYTFNKIEEALLFQL